MYHMATILLPPYFQPLFHNSRLVFRWPWQSAALAHTVTCGPTIPQPSVQVSPPHHGWWCLRLALCDIIGGTSCQSPPPHDAFVGFVSLSTQHAIIVILIVINICFSSFNNVDLSHIMLVDCCMLCCRECGPIAAVWRGHPPWWSCVIVNATCNNSHINSNKYMFF